MENLKELRIGNYVEVNGEISKIEGVIKYGIYYAFGYCPNQDNWIKPIELTEEWLLKFGFEKEDFYFFKQYEWNNWGMRLNIFDGSWVVFHGFANQFSELTVIKFVNQLQNLYFALTGEELIIKDKTNE